LSCAALRLMRIRAVIDADQEIRLGSLRIERAC
jgi:hypothetical protein